MIKGAMGKSNRRIVLKAQERIKFLEYAFKFMEGVDKTADQFPKIIIGEQLDRIKDIVRSGVKNATEETVTQ